MFRKFFRPLESPTSEDWWESARRWEFGGSWSNTKGEEAVLI